MSIQTRQTFETVFPEIRMQWLSSPKPDTYEEQERDFIRLLGQRARQALEAYTPDGERLGHRLQLEAARRALVLISPDRTGLDHAAITDLQWALSDLELGRVRASLKSPAHTKGRGQKKDNLETIAFKACCLKAALLLRGAGDRKLKADARVINLVCDAAKQLRIRMAPILQGDGKRPVTTLDGWRRAHGDRRRSALEGKRTLHVSCETEVDLPPGWPTNGGIRTDRQAADAEFPSGDMETVRYPVEDSVGLVLAVTPSGAKSWQYWCRGSDTERWAWRTLASYPEMTFAQARKEHQKLCRRLAGYLLAFIKRKYGRRQS